MSSLRPSPPADVSSSPPTSLSAPLPTVPEVSVATEPGVFFRRNVDVSVEEETSVRWVTPPMKQAHANGVNVAMCGVGPSPGRTVGDHGLMVTIISEDADHPPVTHRIPRGGGCLENLFNQPGCYTYYVSSGPVVTGRIVAKAPGPQHRSGKPSATAKKIMEAKHGQKSEIEGSLTRAHEREEAVDRCVVPQAALVGPKNCFSSLLQSEIASQWISVINETMAVGGSEICANEAEQVFGMASAVEERYATRVDDVDVAGTDDMVGMSRGKYEGDTLLEARTASIPSPFLSHVPTPPCFEDLSTLEPTSSEGESGWPKDSKVCLDDTDKVIGLLGRGHNGDSPSAVAMASPTLMMLPENTPQSKPPNSTQLEHGSAPAPVSAMRWSDSIEDSPVFVDKEDGVPEPAVQGCRTDTLQATVATSATGSSQARAASSSPRDLQILFGNYVSDADAAMKAAAGTPSVPSSDDQVPFTAAPVGGERGVNTDPLAPSKGTSGWTSLMDNESDDQRKPAAETTTGWPEPIQGASWTQANVEPEANSSEGCGRVRSSNEAGPVVTGRIVAKTPGPQHRSGKPSATAKIMEAKHGQKSEIEGSLTRAHEREEAVDRCVVPQATLVGPKNCFSSLLQSEIASQWISVINETMAVGGSEICANEAEQVFGTASAVEERYATRVDDVDVAGTDDMVGMSRGKYEGDTLLEARTASIPSPFLSHVPTPPCFEDLSTLEPTSSEGESGWPKNFKVCLDDTDKVIGLLGPGHNGDGPSAVAMASPTLMMLPENTPQSKPPNSTQLEHGSAPAPVSAMKWSDSIEDSPVFVDREDGVPEPAVQGCRTDTLQATVATSATGSSQARAASSSPRDLQILFGNYVSDADAAMKAAAGTPSVTSSDDQVPFTAAPVGGERGANTDPLAPSKGTSGWTSLVDDESDDQRKPAAETTTGWPEPIQGASWTQANVEPEAYSSEGCGRMRSSNEEELSYSARDVRGKPRSRKLRSSPVQRLPQRLDTLPGAKASPSQPIPLPLSDQVQAWKVPLDTSACSGWGSVSPSATHGNDNGWPPVENEMPNDSAASAPKSGEPPASSRGVAESVSSGARKTAEFNQPSNGRQEESCPFEDSITKIANSTSTESLKGVV